MSQNSCLARDGAADGAKNTVGDDAADAGISADASTWAAADGDLVATIQNIRKLTKLILLKRKTA